VSCLLALSHQQAFCLNYVEKFCTVCFIELLLIGHVVCLWLMHQLVMTSHNWKRLFPAETTRESTWCRSIWWSVRGAASRRFHCFWVSWPWPSQLLTPAARSVMRSLTAAMRSQWSRACVQLRQMADCWQLIWWVTALWPLPNYTACWQRHSHYFPPDPP